MYSLIIKYPNARPARANSLSLTSITSITTITTIIPADTLQSERRPLIETINKIFDGQYEKLFDENEFVMGQPESIVLTTDVIKYLQTQTQQG